MFRTPQQNLTLSSSQPELASYSDQDRENSLSSRKRKERTEAENLDDLRSEIVTMLSDLKKSQNDKLSALSDMIKDLKHQNQEIMKQNSCLKNALENTTLLYNELKGKYENIVLENNETKNKVIMLENKIEDVLRKQLETSLEITNVPFSEDEDLNLIVSEIHKKLDVSISREQICQIYGKRSKQNKVIVVEYKMTQLRTNVIQALRTYNNNHKDDKFNTKLINLPGERQPIYISESLTPTTRHLLFHAKQAQKKNCFKYCWISYGKVFIKKDDGLPRIHIKTLEQIGDHRTDSDTNTSTHNLSK